jgi:hypothetical protein
MAGGTVSETTALFQRAPFGPRDAALDTFASFLYDAGR